MYKELIISIAIIVVIFVSDFLLQRYTDNITDDLMSSLSSLKDDINKSDVNAEEVQNKTDELYEKWESYNDRLVFYIEHDELEKVETEFATAKSYIQTGQYDFAIAEIEKTEFILQHISDKYTFNLENLF
jgi:uncharacterized protein (UPF0305 family)